MPETTLGLIPAWGGATRLPRLIGAELAAEVISKGKLYPAKEALRARPLDEIALPAYLLDIARRKILEGKRESTAEAVVTPQRPSDSDELAFPAPGTNQAPARALDVIRRGLAGSIDESLALEVDAIVELGRNESTRNLIRNFFLAEKYRKGSSKTLIEKVVHAAVIGAGVMGSGIAQWLSSRSVTVILRDVSVEQLEKGLANVDKTYAEAVKRGLMTDEKAKQGRARIVASANPGPMRDVQIVIEAASEKLEIKKQIFHDLAGKTGPNTILATNTSALPISELAASTETPGRVIGLHFFNPVSRMKLVEVVVGKQTSPETQERALAFARQVGKLPVVVRDSPGFLVNRVLFPYLLHAAELYESGVAAQEIDDPLVRWGMPMGPLRLIDEIGVDITVDIAETLERAFGERDRAPEILRKMQAAKMLGRKTNSGFYKYEGKQQTPNDVSKVWPSTGGHSERSEAERNAGEETRDDSADPARDDLANRLVFLMVNEAARCLEEKVVATAADADYGMILGTGFAPLRGGPLRFADHYGLKKLVAEMDGLHSTVGEKFAPCDLLRHHAQNGTTFYER